MTPTADGPGVWTDGGSPRYDSAMPRRQAARPLGKERRRRDRRSRPPVQQELTAQNFALVAAG